MNTLTPINTHITTALALLALTLPGAAHAQTTAHWLTPVDGNWSDPAMWSIGGTYPNNGTPAPGDTYDVVIGQTGSLYEIDIDIPVHINTLDLSAIYPTLNILPGGSLRVDTPVDITGATINLNGGTLSNTMITGSGLLRAMSGNGTPTLDAVTLGTDLILDTGPNALHVSNGLSLDHADVHFLHSGTLDLDAGQTIGGTGRISLDYNFTGTVGLALQANLAGNLEIDPGIEFNIESGALYFNGGQLTNRGTLYAGHSRYDSARIRFDITTFTNLGTIHAGNGSEVTLRGDWSNANGTIVINGGTVNMEGTYAISDLGQIQWGVSSYNLLRLRGQLDHGGNDLIFDDTSGAISFEATMSGGRIISNKSDLMYLGGSLNNTAVRGEFDSAVTFANNLTLENGAILHGTGGLAVKSSGVAAVTGNGAIVFDNSGSYSYIEASGGTLTFDPGVTIRTGAGGGMIGDASNKDTWINRGTILVETSGQEVDFRGNWHNDGLIRVTDGRLMLNGAWDLSDLGNLEQTGGVIKIDDDYDNTGQTFLLDQPNDTWAHEGDFTGGRLETANGARFQFDVSFVENATLAGAFDAQRVYLTATELDGADLSLHMTDRAIEYSMYPWIRGEDGVIAGTGSITFDEPAAEGVMTAPSKGPLLIEPGITVRTGAGSGVIQADFTNQGTLVADTVGTHLHLDGEWTNQGTFEIGDGQLYLDGSFTPADIGTLTRSGNGQLFLIGDLDLSSTQLDIADLGGDLELHAGARLHGGTVSSSQGDKLILRAEPLDTYRVDPGDYVFLENITLDTDLTILDDRRFYFDGTISLASGHVIRLGSPDPAPSGSQEANLYMEAGTVITGTGEIVFDANSEQDASYVRMHEFDQGITVRSGAGDGRIIRASGVSVGLLKGTIIADQPGRWIELSGTFDHYGTSTASADGLLKILSGDWNNLPGSMLEAKNAGTVELRSDVVNDGLIRSDNGSVQFISSELTNQAAGSVLATNDGTVTINDHTINHGSIFADNGGSFVHGGGTFTNSATGVVTAGPGGVIELSSLTANNGAIYIDGGDLRLGASSGNMTPAMLGTINRNGGRLIFIKGYDNTGMTLDMDGPLGQIILDGQNATITQGNIVGSSGTPLVVINGTLSETTVSTDIEVVGNLKLTRSATLSQVALVDASLPGGQQAVVNIVGGGAYFQGVHVGVPLVVGSTTTTEQLFVDPSTTFAPDSHISIGYNAILHLEGSRLLSDMTIELTSSDSVIEADSGSLVLDPTAVILANGGRDQEVLALSGDLHNFGTITANAGDLTIEAGRFMNHGVLEVLGAGAEVYLKPDWVNMGVFRIGDGELHLSGTVDADRLGQIERVGDGHITLAYVYDNEAAVLDLDETLGDVRLDGNFYGGTVTSSVGNVLFTGDDDCCRTTINKLYGVTLATDLDIRYETREVQIHGGLTLDNADVHLRDGPLFFWGPQHVSGVGRIVLHTTYSDTALMGGGLVIDPGVSIVAEPHGRIGYNGNSIMVSYGQVIADGAGTEIDIEAYSFENRGAIRALDRGTVNVDISHWENHGEIQLAEGTIAFVADTPFNQITNLPGATIHGDGFINMTPDSFFFNNPATLVNRGVLSPAGDSGVLAITGHYRQEETGSLTLTLDDQWVNAPLPPLRINNSASLGGTLQISLDHTGILQTGDSLPILSAASITGAFEDILLPDAAPGTMWTVDYGATDVLLTLRLAGDLNGDGFVGITDLSLVLSQWNQSVTAGDLLMGDPTADGFVGIEDLNLVLGNWNVGTAPSENINTPEPSALVILAIGGFASLRRRT